MGTSNWQHISYCCELMYALQPRSVLDIGVGFGRWGILARQICDSAGTDPGGRRVRILGVEAFPKLIQPYHSAFYDEVVIGDALDYLRGTPERFDLAVLGDVLEHFPRDQAEEVLQLARTKACYTMLGVPLGTDWEQGEMYGNPYERHRSSWRHGDFRRLGPACHRFFADHIGRRHAVYLFAAVGMDARGYWEGRPRNLAAPAWPEVAELRPEGRRSGLWAGLQRRLRDHPRLDILARLQRSAEARVGHVLGAAAAQPSAEPPERVAWEIRDEHAPALAVAPAGWSGVTTSTRNNFANLLLCPETLGRPEEVADEILGRGFSTVVFANATEGFEAVARRLKARAPATRLLVQYHGSFSQNADGPNLARFQRVLRLAREGLVEEVGCAKAGMAPALEALGVRARYLPHRIEPPEAVVHHAARSPRRLGLFLRDIFLKDVRTQFMAACLMRDVEVHANEAPDLSRVPTAPAVVSHGNLPYAEFVQLLGEMDVSFYVSLSECYPMTVMESLIRGVPCLTSHTHEIFAGAEELARALIVEAYDNPAAIAAQAERVLEDREALGRKAEAHAREMNRRAEAALNEFVGFEMHPAAGPGRAAPLKSAPVPVAAPPPKLEGTENWRHASFCAEVLFALMPDSILDVGMGLGRNAILAREICDVWRRRTMPEEWQAEIIGVPAPGRAEQSCDPVYYSQVVEGRAVDFLRRTDRRFDLAILDGALERMSHEEGEEALDLALAKASYVMACVPHDPRWRNKGYHRSHWGQVQLLERVPRCSRSFKDHRGGYYGVHVLASTRLDAAAYWKGRRPALAVPTYPEIAGLLPREGVRQLLPALRWKLRRHPRLEFVARKAYGAARRVRAAVAGRPAPATAARPSGLRWEVRDASAPVLAVVPPGWFGVTTSARGNFPNVLLCTEDLHEPAAAVEEILARGFRTVVFCGATDVFDLVARLLKERSGGTRLLLHYHASLAQSSEPGIRRQFRCVLDLAQDGVVERVGCAKAGVAEALARMGVAACYVPNRAEPPGAVAHHAARSPRRIGIFVRDILRKNAHTQFMAAAMLADAEVHANELPELSYLQHTLRIVTHGDLAHGAFLRALGEMDLNLYVSLSECYPMVVAESLIRGVPCLTSRSHEIFAHDEELGRRLIVSAHDNPAAIAEQAERVLAEREAVGRRCAAYALELNARAEALLDDFVGYKMHRARAGEAGGGR